MLFPISVNTSINANKTNAILKGIAILTDLDRNTKVINPAAKQKIAVLVPDWKNPQITKIEIVRKKDFPFNKETIEKYYQKKINTYLEVC